MYHMGLQHVYLVLWWLLILVSVYTCRLYIWRCSWFCQLQVFILQVLEAQMHMRAVKDGLAESPYTYDKVQNLLFCFLLLYTKTFLVVTVVNTSVDLYLSSPVRAVTCGVWVWFCTSCCVATLHFTRRILTWPSLNTCDTKSCLGSLSSQKMTGTAFPMKLRTSFAGR